MRFGIKDDFIELQDFRRREEQIKIFESLSQHEAFHFVALLFAGDVGECSVTGVRAAIFNKIIKHFLAHLSILRVACEMIKVVSGLHDLGAQMITSGNHLHRFVIKSFRLNVVKVPHLERRGLQATRALQIARQSE